MITKEFAWSAARTKATFVEASLWQGVSYRATAGTYGLPEQPQETEHLTRKTWTRLGATHSFWGTQASAFLNGGIAENTDPLSAFRLGGGLRMRAEFPLPLHGYDVEEVFARRFLLANLSYRFRIWPGRIAFRSKCSLTTHGSTTSRDIAFPAPTSRAWASISRGPPRRASRWWSDTPTVSTRRVAAAMVTTRSARYSSSSRNWSGSR